MTTAVCCRPQETDVATPPPMTQSDETPFGRVTASGRVLDPHCPFVLSPQQYTNPSAVSATVWKEPHATSTTRWFSRDPVTFVGMKRGSLSPCPSRPWNPTPHVKSSPASVMAQLCH